MYTLFPWKQNVAFIPPSQKIHVLSRFPFRKGADWHRWALVCTMWPLTLMSMISWRFHSLKKAGTWERTGSWQPERQQNTRLMSRSGPKLKDAHGPQIVKLWDVPWQCVSGLSSHFFQLKSIINKHNPDTVVLSWLNLTDENLPPLESKR